jgi:hypothetical protein
VIVAKQVLPVGHSELATCRPKPIPVATSALERTNVTVEAVKLPFASKQSVVPKLPQAPVERAPVLRLLIIDVPPWLMLPEKPIVGPPNRTVLLPFIVMLTHTEVAAAAQPPVPPWVRVAVPIKVVPSEMSNVSTDVAEATGTIARQATSNSAKTESLRLVIRTTSPPLGANLYCSNGLLPAREVPFSVENKHNVNY